MTSGIDLDRVDKLLLDPSFSPPLPYLPIPHASLPTLRFTPFLSSDIPSLVRTLNDPLVFPFLIGPPYPYTLSDGQYWSDLREEQYRKWKVGGDGKTEGWTLSTIRVGREWVGTMGVERWKFEEVGDLEERRRRYEENRGKKVGEESVVWAIGYYLSPQYFSRGIASAALSTLLSAYMIPILNCQTIKCSAYVGNAASRRVMEKCGFQLVGRFVSPIDEGRGGGMAEEWEMEWKRDRYIEVDDE